MRWLSSAECNGHKLSLLGRILLLSLILCLLVFTTPGLADETSDPDDPVAEHPWDDLERSNARQNSPGGAVNKDYEAVIHRFGWSGLWIIIDIEREKGKD